MATKVDAVWVDGPLITREGRLPRKGFKFPWQSDVKGQVYIHSPFTAFILLRSGKQLKVEIESGFPTDYYSIPWAVRWLIPKSQIGWNQAAVVHDKLYVTNKAQIYYPETDSWSDEVTLNRATVDQIFLHFMKYLNTPLIQRQSIYHAVRVGGGGPWRKRRKQDGNN